MSNRCHWKCTWIRLKIWLKLHWNDTFYVIKPVCKISDTFYIITGITYISHTLRLKCPSRIKVNKRILLLFFFLNFDINKSFKTDTDIDVGSSWRNAASICFSLKTKAISKSYSRLYIDVLFQQWNVFWNFYDFYFVLYMLNTI